jgi:hypothetical protein
LSAILDALTSGAERCEEAKATSLEAWRQSLPSYIDASDAVRLHPDVVWRRAHDYVAATTDDPQLAALHELRKKADAAQRAHRDTSSYVITLLGTQLLTSACKQALADAVPKARKQCETGEQRSTDWLRVAARAACEPGTPR